GQQAAGVGEGQLERPVGDDRLEFLGLGAQGVVVLHLQHAGVDVGGAGVGVAAGQGQGADAALAQGAAGQVLAEVAADADGGERVVQVEGGVGLQGQGPGVGELQAEGAAEVAAAAQGDGVAGEQQRGGDGAGAAVGPDGAAADRQRGVAQGGVDAD